MAQPPGFVHPDFPNHICKLHKAIYGLKQSPRAWYATLRTALLSLDFIESKSDTALFTYHAPQITTYFLVYVDDIILTGNSKSFLTKIIFQLNKLFPVKDLGQLHYFLGMEATRTKDGLFLSQSKYIDDILTRADMIQAKPLHTPVSAGSSLSKHDGDPLSDPFLYRSIVGALQYLTLTRPELAFAVNRACQFMQTPTSSHWGAVKRILRYLRHTPRHGIFLRPNSQFTLVAYSDADWAGCPNDRRSTTGFCIFLGDNLVSWNSKKQQVVARSSTESEYRALAYTTADLCWIQSLLSELRVSLSSSPVLWCDNIGAAFLLVNPVFHARTKHIEIDFHFVREKVTRKQLLIQYIPTEDQVADIFTKGLSSHRFALLRSKLTVCASPFRLKGDDKVYVAREEEDGDADVAEKGDDDATEEGDGDAKET
ncbi:uncharacterized mitochondrial protein AtMg00810-like [Impatiens glandulifera]|uniref:uncharacterized mitochondrial protein AtMg00810-like n=1 Tax=Impatiens glandulifera TaxID=253017 RepID=UPI001FB079D2|nr:uncharacterized mitochondrial protein AtMg00810-like [Impatiens glandulifera]